MHIMVGIVMSAFKNSPNIGIIYFDPQIQKFNDFENFEKKILDEIEWLSIISKELSLLLHSIIYFI